MPTIEDTKALIARAHAKQTDKAGKPYVEHLMRVYHRLKQKRSSVPDHLPSPEDWEQVLHAGLLHDILEDTPYTADDLRALGYAEAVIGRVEIVTRRESERLTYPEKIRQIAGTGDIGAILIKLADNEDNSDPQRVRALPDGRALVQRYEASKQILCGALERLLAT
jgi:(p)ppGpp synthase/HD superfamily hydrolase